MSNDSYFHASYIGLKIGSFKVIDIKKSNNSSAAVWVCQCRCGRDISLLASLAIKGRDLRCECGYTGLDKITYDDTEDTAIRIGDVAVQDKMRLKTIFRVLVRRCYDTKYKYYIKYGGIGIGIYDRWLEDIDNFIVWAVNNGYRSWLNIDLISKDGSYTPDNCVWVPRVKNKSAKISTESLDTVVIDLKRLGIHTEKLRKDLQSGKISQDKIGAMQSILSRLNKGTDNLKYKLVEKIDKDIYHVRKHITELIDLCTVNMYIGDETKSNKDSIRELESILVTLDNIRATIIKYNK